MTGRPYRGDDSTVVSAGGALERVSGLSVRMTEAREWWSMTPVALVSVDGVALDAVVHAATGVQGLGTVVLAHGITVDRDEGGMFVRLAQRLAEVGFTVLRFSFRGHGASGGSQRGVTIAGELLDLQAVIEHARQEYPGLLSIVAASFGAVSTALSFPYLDDLHSVVLWNPVLDLRRTFVDPELPWGLDNYGPQQQKLLASQGFLLIDDEFQLGRVVFEEFRHYRPDQVFIADDRPALVVHGDRDSYVSYDIARTAAAARANCEFHTVAGSDHGFDSREREEEAIQVTVEWLLRQHTSRA